MNSFQVRSKSKYTGHQKSYEEKRRSMVLPINVYLASNLVKLTARDGLLNEVILFLFYKGT